VLSIYLKYLTGSVPNDSATFGSFINFSASASPIALSSSSDRDVLALDKFLLGVGCPAKHPTRRRAQIKAKIPVELCLKCDRFDCPFTGLAMLHI
jgi:hypothetical protein